MTLLRFIRSIVWTEDFACTVLLFLMWLGCLIIG